MNRSREIARAIEASLATETARKRGLVEVFLSRGLPPPPPPPNEASASVDASEETLARENEGGGDIDDEKDANGDEETIEGLKRALASSQARARAPTSWTPPWTPPSGSGVFFIHVCVYFPYHRSHRARGSSNLCARRDFHRRAKSSPVFQPLSRRSPHRRASLFSPSVSRHRTEPNRTMRNPLPFIAASASNGDSPTSRRASSRHRRRPGESDEDAVLEYWARVRAGVEPAPRPGAEAAVNKRRCAHLQSHIGDVLSGEGSTSRRTGAEDGEDAAGALEVGEKLADEDVLELKTRGWEEVGEPLAEAEVVRLKSLGSGSRRSEAGAYSMPLAPEGDAAEGDEEDAFEEEAGEFFDYDRHELPRHMKDWYAPPGEEYGSFFDVNAPAAGQYDWKSEERKYATVRNLRSHALW